MLSLDGEGKSEENVIQARKKKKRLSKGERRRRKRQREAQEAGLGTGDNDNTIQCIPQSPITLNSTATTKQTSSSIKTHDGNISMSLMNAKTDYLSKTNHSSEHASEITTAVKSISSPSIPSMGEPITILAANRKVLRGIEFVYPRKFSLTNDIKPSFPNRQHCENAKPIPYVFSKLQRFKDQDEKQSSSVPYTDLMTQEVDSREALNKQSIDDILFPHRKRQKQEDFIIDETPKGTMKNKIVKQEGMALSDKGLYNDGVQPIDDKGNGGLDDKHGATEPRTSSKQQPTTDRSSHVAAEEGKTKEKLSKSERNLEDDTTRSKSSATEIQSGTNKQKRSHSEVVAPSNTPIKKNSDHPTMKRQLSGMTVEDAVKDELGRRPRANSTDGELNLPRRGLCDEHTVLESHKWNMAQYNTISPSGFVNLGNTCFLNATLQCLAYLPTFCQCVVALPSSGDGSNENKLSTGQRITMMMRSLLRKVHGLDGEKTTTGVIAPKSIVRAVPLLGGTGRGYKFRPGRQEDAHEFLIHLLDIMNDGELRAAGRIFLL